MRKNLKTLNMNRISHTLIISCFSLLFFISCKRINNEFTQYVDPFIGTDAHGHVYPGAAMPFGMVQLSPDTRKDSWDGCSGYHYSDKTVMGFSHTHLSGTGVGDYGDIRVMPTIGQVKFHPGTEDNPTSGYRSRFSHSAEVATPGYYSVELDDYNILAELTVSYHTGMHRYTFPQSTKANILFDLAEGVTSDKVLNTWIEKISDTEIQGLRQTQGWARNQYVFFNAEFSKPFNEMILFEDSLNTSEITKSTGTNVKACFVFDTKENEKILLKVGISAVSAEGARNNRLTEIDGWDFESVRSEAVAAWENELGRIRVDDSDRDRKTVFYTALYHALLNPNLFSDVDGKYRGHDMQIHQDTQSAMYTVFSLWDTFRAAHPLFTLIDQKRTNDFINSMLKHYEQGGLLPVWELAANETNCMIGYHAVPVIVDAYMKDIRGYDTGKAFDACIKSAEQDQFGLKWYKEKGYIPSDKESESVSKTLEYAYDDWCIAQMAKELGRNDQYRYFLERGQYYKNVFDPQTKFMRAKANETWFSPFDPAEVNFNYTEANSWQYSFFVPQDVSGFMQLLGGSDSLANRLDKLFSVSSKTTGREQSDITGLIGQYAHGNEPSHHIAYLYNYTGKPWKTQAVVRQIMDELYTSAPDGLCGNEDCGQMSAWYALSAMGIYQVTPGSAIYAIGSPVFEKVTLKFENGNHFVIQANNQSKTNKYIKSATLNGVSYTKSFLTHETLLNGGTLVFEMTNEPDKSWATQAGDMPVSAISEHLITPVPFVKSGEKVFYNEQTIELACALPEAIIEFSLSEDGKKVKADKYSTSLMVTSTTVIAANAKADGKSASKPIEALFEKIPEGRTIKIRNKYSNQYNAGGDIALIDFQRGGNDFRTGTWQGYEGVDLEAIVDLSKKETIKSLSTGFLQDNNAWIFMPLYVEYFISADGANFKSIGRVESPIADNDGRVIVHDFTLTFKPAKTRYLKVVGKNRGNCPAWHKGAGNAAWIFADEIEIK